MTGLPSRIAAVFAGGLLLAGFGCNGSLSERVPPQGSGPVDLGNLASIELSANVPVLAVGQNTVLSVVYRSDTGVALDPVPLTWTSSDPAVLTVDDSGNVAAVAEGQTDISAAAGELVSNTVSLRVVAASGAGTATVRVFPELVAMAPADTRALSGVARDPFGEEVVDPALTWETGDPAVATVDATGVVTAVADGTTEVWATYAGVASEFRSVQVTSNPDYLGVRLDRPSGDTAAQNSLDIAVTVARFLTGPNPGFGNLVMPDAVEVFAGGTSLGMLTPEFGGGSAALDVSTLPDGAHTLRVRAAVGAEEAWSPHFSFIKWSTGTGYWGELGAGSPTWATPYGDTGTLSIIGDEVYVLPTVCGRECSVQAWQFNEGSNEWDRMNYQRREYRDWNDEPIEEIIRDNASNADLPRFVGWGWVSTDARQSHALVGATTPTVAFSNREARTSFNVDPEPEHYWFDCHVSQWSATGGYDGAGGWVLLGENPSYLADLPHPTTLPSEYAEQRLPGGANAVRTEECAYPKIVEDGTGTLLVAFVTTPVPNVQWTLHLRSWDGSQWQDAATPLEIPGQQPQVYDLVTDESSGRPVVAVDHDGRPKVFRLDTGDTWQQVGDDTSPHIVSLVGLSGGGLLGAAVEEGDLSVYVGSTDSWAKLGNTLDRGAWATVQEASLEVINGEFFAAWAEGPGSGQWDALVATWRADEARWEILGGGPVESAPDRDVFNVQLSSDASGRLIVRHSAPNDPSADLSNAARAFLQHVHRSASPAVP